MDLRSTILLFPRRCGKANSPIDKGLFFYESVWVDKTDAIRIIDNCILQLNQSNLSAYPALKYIGVRGEQREKLLINT